MNVLRLLNRNVLVIKGLIFCLSIIPAIQLFYRYKTDQLGINGLETLLHTTGYSALIFYILTLSVTPLRRMLSFSMIIKGSLYGKRLGDWNWMVKIRRMLGVFSFLYALLHFVVFYYFELDLDLNELAYEVRERPFITVGLLALLSMLPLFLTSTNYSMRILKRNWRRLHRLMYPIGLMIAIHYLWLTKPGVYSAYPYALVIVLLLMFRALDHYKILFKRLDDGMASDR